MMISTREYILLSIISYCNFTENEYGKDLDTIFRDKNNQKIITGTFDILLLKNRKFFLEYFGDVLKEWKFFCR